MMVSSKGRYALRVMIYLAQNDREELIPLKEKFINPFSDIGFKMIYYASFAIQQQATYAKEQLERALEQEAKNGCKAETKLLR